MAKRTTAERFWSHVEKTETCWLWTGYMNPHGYGQFRVGGRAGLAVLVHRWAYQQCVGPIPAGLQLDHLCRVRRCVRPSHLEPVTCRENQLRGDTFTAAKTAQTHCRRGHELTEANIYRRPDRPHTRECRRCIAERGGRGESP
jgi:hypothetical protein